MNLKYLIGISVIISTLNGCGGGSNSSTESETPPPNATAQAISVSDATFSVGQSIEFILYLPEQTITSIQWKQTQGSPVELLASKSKVISFTPNEIGTYEFEVSFNEGNQESTLTRSIDVTGNQKSLVARLGHAAVEGNKVSLRASVDNTIKIDSLTWTQLSGPNVSLVNSNGELSVYFDAPDVSKDELVEIEVAAETIAGELLSDKVSMLVENKPVINANAYFDNPVATVAPFIEDSPYADTIVDCVYSNELSSSCRLSSLPLIAQDTLSPSVDDIMERVVVSHPWMGERFKAFLEQYDTDNDFKNLLRATTAIVISYDIRPAFYWAATGAIYLDPDYLWLTPSERDTINEAPDYRSGFGSELQFEMLWRYVKNSNYASKYFPLNERINRDSNDILFDLGYLLYHELAHANDFFPSTKWQQLSSNTRVLDAALNENTQSDILDISYPLNSQVMKDLAQVRYTGANPSNQQISYQPSDIESYFEPDGAVYFYSYTSTREDYAMLFEELMMYSRYGISRDIAITNNPPNGSPSSAYIVNWGQRGRVAEEHLTDRVIFATERVLPEFDAQKALLALPQVKQLSSGANWAESLELENLSPYSLANDLVKRSMPKPGQPVKTGSSYYHKPLPIKHNEQSNQ